MRRYAAVDLGDSESALIVYRDIDEDPDKWYLYEVNVQLRNVDELVDALNLAQN